MSDKIDKGLSVFKSRNRVHSVPEPEKGSSPEVVQEVKIKEPESRPVNHLESTRVTFEPREQLLSIETGKFSFNLPNSLLDQLEDLTRAVKRKTGWRMNKKDFLIAFLEAYFANNSQLPDAKNYPELVVYLKKVLKE